jgi:NDP-sugar pyrophosphorylase family protein
MEAAIDMRGMILAAGLGTRLWPLTIDRAKAAIPVLGRPLIGYSIDYLRKFGITEPIINLHHQGETIREAVRQCAPSDVNVTYSEELEILGTGGALDKVRHLLEDETFVVINGKIITDIDLASAIDAHRARGALATLILQPNTKLEKFSKVEVDADGWITGFGGFPQPGAERFSEPPLMFTGIQVVEPEIFDYIPRNRFSHTTTEAYPKAIAERQLILGHIATGEWFELSTLERYLDISLEFLRRQGQNYFCDVGSVIESGVKITESIVWRRARICAGARLHRCIIGDDVIIPSGAEFECAVIVRAALCPNPDRGDIIGDNLVAQF